jgi:hypothetical protein
VARGQAGVAVFLGELAGGEVAYPLELEAEEQDEGPGSADANGDGGVGEAALDELPPLFFVEEVRWPLAREDGDVQGAAEAAGGGPVQEVPGAVAPLGLFLCEPAVDVVLPEAGKDGPLPVDPGQELQGDQDPDAQLAAYRGGERPPRGPAASPAQQGPVQERTDEERVLGRLAGQMVSRSETRSRVVSWGFAADFIAWLAPSRNAAVARLPLGGTSPWWRRWHRRGRRAWPRPAGPAARRGRRSKSGARPACASRFGSSNTALVRAAACNNRTYEVSSPAGPVGAW